MPNNSIKVSTDIRRDILQSAALFRNEAAAIWEYVANSLQYVDRGVTPRVNVRIAGKGGPISISDNGRGMTSEDLTRFFRMHGENLDRLQGRVGRGKFGTGKSAAFGIANSLSIDTRRDGKRNVATLTRAMIDDSTGDEIGVRWDVRDERTSLANGTTITIADVTLAKVGSSQIIQYIERHLQAYRAQSPEVAVNDHVCEYREPAVSRTVTFEPDEDQRALLGNIILTVRIAQAPLDESDQGIAITAGLGNLVARERAGIGGKEMGNYLFGEVDVPSLETYVSPIQPFSPDRGLTLNVNHPVAAVLVRFIGARLEKVRLELVGALKEQRKSELARRLQQTARDIARILNEDFLSVQQKLGLIRTASGGGAVSGKAGRTLPAGDTDEAWVEGVDTPGSVDTSAKSLRTENSNGRAAPKVSQTGTPNSDGERSVSPVGGDGPASRPRGGFQVEYGTLGHEEDRSRYDPNTLRILINLDHPTVREALGAGATSDPSFLRLSYEIAFSEYAIALGYETMERDPGLPADDLLYEIRSTLNRVSRAAAHLYRAAID